MASQMSHHGCQLAGSFTGNQGEEEEVIIKEREECGVVL